MMETTWEERMGVVVETARFLSSCNVLDITFENGDTKEVYIAATPQERAAGLSHVASLDLDGMLFVYEKPSFVPFTMSQMEMDLDIAWYDALGKLIKFGQFQAGHSSPIFCPQSFSYVLEAPINTLSQTNLKVRDGS